MICWSTIIWKMPSSRSTSAPNAANRWGCRSVITLEAQVGALLQAQAASLAVAESCTGGLLGSRLTDVSGSSSYFWGGVIAYANAAKQQFLNVPEALLLAHGAVSAPVAEAMARGVQNAFGTEYALSVTGIAGPGGGTPEKPVGLTFIGLARPGHSVEVTRHVWPHDRAANKAASVEAALRMLLAALQARADG
ncbi:MAG: nicotinamide-nucleotide amidohydrolase family protein [Anaerolineae bacterium]|nr:nicotinamide-nucleotide amidohydrolase family protein [Anaerolineae bacterium]